MKKKNLTVDVIQKRCLTENKLQPIELKVEPQSQLIRKKLVMAAGLLTFRK